MDAGTLLKTMLPMAVTLDIMRLKGVPWAEVQAMAQGHAQFIAEHGDNLLFLGPKKGDTSKAFTKFSQGIAALSFVPGGVNIFGLHFEATHPDSLNAEPGRWLYHSTFSQNLPSIAKEGLIPTEKGTESVYPKVYLTGMLREAARSVQWAFGERNFQVDGDPVLLKVHSAHLSDIQQAESASDDWFLERKIPWAFIQAWVPEKQAWIDVREVVAQGYFEGPPQWGTTPDDFANYIAAAWPTV